MRERRQVADDQYVLRVAGRPGAGEIHATGLHRPPVHNHHLVVQDCLAVAGSHPDTGVIRYPLLLRQCGGFQGGGLLFLLPSPQRLTHFDEDVRVRADIPLPTRRYAVPAQR